LFYIHKHYLHFRLTLFFDESFILYIIELIGKKVFNLVKKVNKEEMEKMIQVLLNKKTSKV